MIRIVCPFCHAPLSLHELIQAEMGERSSLLCPECLCMLVTEVDADKHKDAVSVEALTHA